MHRISESIFHFNTRELSFNVHTFWLSAFVCPPIYVPACVVCSRSDCVGEMFANMSATCVGEVNVFSLKVIVLCCFLLASPCMVFQRVCVFCL